MVRQLVVGIFAAAVVSTCNAEGSLETEALLAQDDECNDDAEACALNAIQLRGQKVHVQNAQEAKEGWWGGAESWSSPTWSFDAPDGVGSAGPIRSGEGPVMGSGDASCTEDQNPSCSGWAKADCKDENPSCVPWSTAGECERNPTWMKANCKMSCKACEAVPAAGANPAMSATPGVPGTPGAAAAVPTTQVATTTPVWATSDCQTATPDNPALKACYDAVTWVFTNGLTSNPDWFPGLTFSSPFESVQYKMHSDGRCPMPCAPTNDGCKSAMSDMNSECYKAVIFAKNDGIYGHPEWFPELKASSPIDDFQMHLHNQNATLCPKPCKQ